MFVAAARTKVRWITQYDQDAQDLDRFGMPFETSKTSRSVVLAISSSTIKKLREYMILKVLLLAIAASLP